MTDQLSTQDRNAVAWLRMVRTRGLSAANAAFRLTGRRCASCAHPIEQAHTISERRPVDQPDELHHAGCRS